MDVQSEKLLAQIIRNTRVASLGTLRDESPLVSMVAYVSAQDFSAFYIFVSRLAQHTIDMQKDKRMCLLIAETDDGRADPQTLARVTIRGSAEMMEIGEPGYTPVKRQYIERFPESAMLFNLEDFGMWRIKPKGGRYVAGLAKAFNITPETLLKVAAR
ncbi:pyridoxamine 5'-phosphate oxidase family protein [Candidatus Villigracilis saccharophilus]|uniref:HugZ family pyridoxamine 5'-phosphate oxidase n=1 Tax=Candidatus Villigracilis saccharophilus TaxID=3140684 RepID=UPI0031369CCC|nr:pyridoxamine 5'-phosphate oxidase family protein [Anaerolineales bacterium]